MKKDILDNFYNAILFFLIVSIAGFLKIMKLNSHEIIQSVDGKTEALVSVSEWLVKESVKEQYIEHPRSFWLLWNYYRRIGVVKVITKLKSRFYEKERNNKVAGLFIGYILDAPIGGDLEKGSFVLCFASNHSANSNIHVLNKHFIVMVPNDKCIKPRSGLSISPQLRKFISWTRFSGNDLNELELKQAIENYICDAATPAMVSQRPTEVYASKLERSGEKSDKPNAVLFGLGNYAKTSILPNIKRNINLQRVHELDPDQLKFLQKRKDISLDTSATPCENLKFDVWFIAGFHHTHSDLAIEALKQGACAVIEKPLVTTMSQYDQFNRQINESENPRFYACFHKRYSELHDLFIRDLKDDSACPVDMHCIVYEIPLPINHWYNWPNSGSRLISNGCHWLDYFMFLNSYSNVIDIKKWIPRGDDMTVQVMLENGAYFSMSLTDTGSQRLGVRDYIELRAAGTTFTMTDGDRYTAENRSRIFSKARINPLAAYSRMYSKISQDIANNGTGDDKLSLRSTKLMLDLESL